MLSKDNEASKPRLLQTLKGIEKYNPSSRVSISLYPKGFIYGKRLSLI